MARDNLSRLAKDLKPYIVPWIETGGQGRGGGGVTGGAGVTDHGALVGLADNDHNQYLLRSGNNVMTGDLNLGGNDITNVGLIAGFDINGFSGTLTSLQTTVAQLGTRTVLAGDGIDSDGVTLIDGSPTVAVDVSDFAGAGLMDDGANNLRVRAGDGLALDGLYVAVDETFNFAWTGNHTHAGSIGSLVFNSADPIQGWRIEADGNAWFSGIEATSLTIKTFVSDVTLALAGSEVVTKSKAILSRDFSTPATTGTLYVYDLPGQPDTAVFESGDFIRLRYVNRATGLNAGDVYGTVSAYSDLADGEQSWTFTRTAGNSGQTIYEGMVALDYGVSGDGYIELSSLGDDTPYVVLRTWETTPAVAGNHTTRAILGNLAGHTDADYGILSGYGLFTELGYTKGALAAGDGAVVVGEAGINIAGGDATYGDINAVQWKADPFDPSSATIAAVYGFQYEEDLLVTNFSLTQLDWGGSTGADQAIVELRADESVGGGAVGRFVLTGKSVPSAELWLEDDSNNAGTLTLKANVTLHEHVVPALTNDVDLGDGSHYFRAIYVNQIYAGTTYSTDTGHDHNDLYNTKAEIASLLLGKADADHAHAGLVTSVALATTLADYIDTDALALALDDYDTSAEVDAKIADLSAATHSHNLADLAERNYGSLQSRGHVLATAAGLGEDHTVSGLTAGHVLRATGAAAAKFMQPLYTDLGSRTHDIISEHSATAAIYSVIGTPSAPNTLAIWTTGSDGTAGNVLLRSDVSGDLELRNLTANDVTAAGVATGTISASSTAAISGDVTIGDASLGWLFDVSAGQLKSRNYNAADPEAGILLDVTDGRIEALDISARSGRLRAAVFELDSTVVGPSSEMWTRKGGAMTADSVTVVASGSITVAVHDGGAGHFPQFEVGETIRLRGYATTALTQQVEGATYTPDFLVMFAPALERDRLLLADVYLEITDVSNQDTHYEYICDWLYGDDKIIFPEGTPVIGYGAATDGAPLGAMKIDADANGPRITAFQYGDEAWDETLIFAAGDISSVHGMDGDEIGVAASSDLTSSTAAAFVGSNKRLLLRNADFSITDGSGDTILAITNENGMQIASGTDNKSWIEMLTSDGDVYARMGSANIQPLGVILKSSQPGFVLESLYQDPRNIGIPDFWENGSGWGAGEFSSRMQMRSLDENNEIGASISTVISTISAFTETGFATWGQVDIAANDAIHLDSTEVVVRGDTTFWDSTAFYGDTDFVGLVGIGANSRWLWPSPPAESEVSSGYLYVDSNGFVKVKS